MYSNWVLKMVVKPARDLYNFAGHVRSGPSKPVDADDTLDEKMESQEKKKKEKFPASFVTFLNATLKETECLCKGKFGFAAGPDAFKKLTTKWASMADSKNEASIAAARIVENEKIKKLKEELSEEND